MATSVGLNFRLTAAVDKFESSMKDVERRLERIDKSSRDTANGMKLLAGIEVGKLLVGGLTKVFNLMSSGVSSLISFANSIRESVDKVGKLAESLGMNEVALQIFLKTASLSGMSADQFGSAVLAMNKRLGEFYNGTGPAKKALESLGFSMDDLKGKTPHQQLKMIATAIMLLPTQAQRAAAAFAIFGDAGKKMLPTLDAIATNVDNIAKRGLGLGQFLSTRQVNAIEKMNDAFSDVWDTIKGIGAQIVANLAEPVEKMLQNLLQFVAAYKSFTTDATGGTGLANDITIAIAKGAVVLGEWADMLLQGLVTFYEMMKSLFERLFQFSHDTLGTDLHSSPEANKLQDELDAIEDKLKKLDKLMSMELIGSEEYKQLWEERNKLEKESVGIKKDITAAEKDYWRAKTEATTGMGSIGGAMQDWLNNFIQGGGGGPMGNPIGGGGGGGGNRPPGSPPDASGLWVWDPVRGGWLYTGGPGSAGPGVPDDPHMGGDPEFDDNHARHDAQQDQTNLLASIDGKLNFQTAVIG